MFQISLSLCVFLPVFLHLSLTVLFTLPPSFTLAVRSGCSGEETCLLSAPSLSPVPFLPRPAGLKDRPLEKAHFVSEDDAAVAALGAGLLPRGTEWWNLEPIRGREQCLPPRLGHGLQAWPSPPTEPAYPAIHHLRAGLFCFPKLSIISLLLFPTPSTS